MLETNENTASFKSRRKHFNLKKELTSIQCDGFAEEIKLLGVNEFASSATLTVEELGRPGSGIPRPAARPSLASPPSSRSRWMPRMRRRKRRRRGREWGGRRRRQEETDGGRGRG